MKVKEIRFTSIIWELPRLSKFVKFKDCLMKKDYVSASSEMLSSRWANQTPNRANELAEIMRSIV